MPTTSLASTSLQRSGSASGGKERADGVGASDEDQLERGFTGQDVESRGHGHGGAVVTAHGVHGNAERSRH